MSELGSYVKKWTCKCGWYEHREMFIAGFCPKCGDDYIEQKIGRYRFTREGIFFKTPKIIGFQIKEEE